MTIKSSYDRIMSHIKTVTCEGVYFHNLRYCIQYIWNAFLCNIQHKYLLIRCGTNIDTPGMASWFKLAGQRHIVSKQAVAWHFNTDHTCQHRTCMNTYPQLRQKGKKVVGEEKNRSGRYVKAVKGFHVHILEVRMHLALKQTLYSRFTWVCLQSKEYYCLH